MSAAGVASKGEARRLIQQGGVTLDGDKHADPAEMIDVAARAPFVLKAGKRTFVRVVLA